MLFKAMPAINVLNLIVYTVQEHSLEFVHLVNIPLIITLLEMVHVIDVHKIPVQFANKPIPQSVLIVEKDILYLMGFVSTAQQIAQVVY